MTSVLHIHCGDSSADALRRGAADASVMAWCDLLMEGPLPCAAGPDEWRRVRAGALSFSTSGQLAEEQALAKLAAQDHELEKFHEYDEVVLWFDACLYDQMILVRQLDWFSRQEMGRTKLGLLCLGEFPGFERLTGLGELAPHQMASLVGTHHPVTAAETDLARRTWAALLASDPTRIEEVLAGDTAALPYLGDALRRYLQQFPSVRNGLNRLENEVLSAVADGYGKLAEIFVHVDRQEERPFFGDTMLWACIHRLAEGRTPALAVDGPGPLPLWNPPRKLVAWTVRITDAGLELVLGRRDWVRSNGIDRWLGGVHLQGAEAAWRWDARTGRLTSPPGSR